MVKKSILEREKKRIKLVNRYKKKRDELCHFLKRKDISFEERWNATLKLSSMKRDSSFVRRKNRCDITGRARGYYRRFGLSRIKVRELCSWGCVSGIVKLSW
ncbi:MAG: 30S ribosomal protein S14 [Rickettsiaceae bacterium H1]|nr:30S ribosomal protein S14 [Rickettsiaceae bacterium H1]